MLPAGQLHGPPSQQDDHARAGLRCHARDDGGHATAPVYVPAHGHGTPGTHAHGWSPSDAHGTTGPAEQRHVPDATGGAGVRCPPAWWPHHHVRWVISHGRRPLRLPVPTRPARAAAALPMRGGMNRPWTSELKRLRPRAMTTSSRWPLVGRRRAVVQSTRVPPTPRRRSRTRECVHRLRYGEAEIQAATYFSQKLHMRRHVTRQPSMAT
mmetsp:Transcript_18718/g.50297  ORF Transcript_18718/g.50297 Transcript_18718/m.50297 type:complete len:210 (+) Transcript_18718:792-1421(+)